MSLYMTLIFGVLVTEVVITTLLVLPLPHAIRKKLIQSAFLLWDIVHFRITLAVCSVLIGVMFVDLAQKSFKYPVLTNAEHPVERVAGTHVSHGYNDLSSSEYLAKKFYHQRNFYITGIVLYLGVVIPTIVKLLGKIVKWDNNLVSKANLGDDKETQELKLLLEQKKTDVETLKKQIEGLQKAYDKKADEKVVKVEENSKTK